MRRSVGYCGGDTLTLAGKRLILSVAILLFSTIPSARPAQAVEGKPEPGANTPEAPKELIGKDGAPMVLIPAGDFLMGSSDDDSELDERPEHRVWVDAFYLDKYEVSNARYDKFLEETGRVRPKFWEQIDLSVHGELPVVGVDWADAKAYCEWAGKRLPTEAEWEYAARGKDKRQFPWGSNPPAPQLANYGKPWSYKFYDDRLERVTSHEAGKSPFGVLHLAGNVWEWVADWYDEYYYESSPERNPPGPPEGKLRVVRGGSWNFAAEYMRTTARFKFDPIHRAADLGIRCARDVG